MPRPHFGKNYWQVEAIVGMKYHKDKRQILYEVKWKGFATIYNTWEPQENLKFVKSMLQQFHGKETKKTKQSLQGFSNKEKQSPLYQKTKKILKNTFKQRQRQLSKQMSSEKNTKQQQKEIRSEVQGNQYSSEDKMESEQECTIKVQSSKAVRKRQRLNSGSKRRQGKYEAKSIQTKSELFKSMEIDEESQEQDQDVQDLLLHCQNIGDVTIIFQNNKFYFQIPFKKEGREDRFQTTKQQILKINPGWLHAYYTSFLL